MHPVTLGELRRVPANVLRQIDRQLPRSRPARRSGWLPAMRVGVEPLTARAGADPIDMHGRKRLTKFARLFRCCEGGEVRFLADRRPVHPPWLF